ncbi:gamma-glutamylputrescine oxidase [Pseudoduganella namucuonensis]|uniref:Gamma-glutamylputrescine oxidase n=1 Tax=Pseudoduganella namucuonensis TaxID=1035707 RepID=A0A1I7M638_9BURK|nr:gamma-glutamylputrescine oxidase [Pseudoduganella namucuonensis]
MSAPLSELSYYRATAGGASWPALDGDVEADICVIGGGFAGLATAMSLMERGQRNVVLLEAETVGHGASGRNGGFVFGGYSLGERALVDSAGTDQGRKLYQLTLDAVSTIKRRIEQYGIQCEAAHGGIYLANWFDDDRILDEQQRFMAGTLGVEWRRVSRADFADRARSKRYFGALYEENAFHFHPLKYAQGLARALACGGVRVHEQSRVRSIEAAPRLHAAGVTAARACAGADMGAGAGWRIATAEGEVRAGEVVVCCGGYIERLYPKLAGAILPIATYVMVTEPLGERLPTALATDAAIYDTRFAFDYYRPLPDTRLLWGGRISIRERSAAAVAKLLSADMLKVYPQLVGTKVDYAWSGMMSYGRHKMPQLGRLPEGIWYGMGFGGHGVAPTTLSGEVLAAALTGEVACRVPFDRRAAHLLLLRTARLDEAIENLLPLLFLLPRQGGKIRKSVLVSYLFNQIDCISRLSIWFF